MCYPCNIMARVWEKFTGGPVVSTRDRLHITLNAKGMFCMNRKMFEALSSPKAVVLYFEKDTGVIGITSAHERLREAFPVKEKMGCVWQIYAIPFCRHFGIKLDGTEAFVNPDFDNEGVLQLDLRTTRKVFGGHRRLNKLRREAGLAAEKKAA